MAPLTPFWTQPSHPQVQKVLVNKEKEYFTKSISLVDLEPYALFAKFEFPPCTVAEEPTYATVQMGKGKHFDLNSDLVYINHSCEPSLIFDTSSMSIIVGPKGLKKNDELTFFYPSTEWEMAQGFSCFCGAPTCRGFISGAKTMTQDQLSGNWLNAHIRALIEERDSLTTTSTSASPTTPSLTSLLLSPSTPHSADPKDATEAALQIALKQAKKMVSAAQHALDMYKSFHGVQNGLESGDGQREGENGTEDGVNGGKRRGVTSRELSGEMGGDTEE